MSMSVSETKAVWNSLTPAERITRMGASKTTSLKVWDDLTVMQQILVCLTEELA